MKLGAVIQQPIEELDYDFDFTDWFAGTGDVIDSIDAVSSPAGLTLLTLQVSDTVAKVWVSGGTHGVVYSLEVTITSVGGRVKQDELDIIITEFT